VPWEEKAGPQRPSLSRKLLVHNVLACKGLGSAPLRTRLGVNLQGAGEIVERLGNSKAVGQKEVLLGEAQNNGIQ